MAENKKPERSEPRIKREDLKHDPQVPGEPGVGFVIEYQVTRDRVVQDDDDAGNLIGWTRHGVPPRGRGWQRVPGYKSDHKTKWRRFRPAINGVPLNRVVRK
jgi:hypothetical protein